MLSKENDRDIDGAMERAMDLTAEALGEIARIAVQEIHAGLEASSHVEAAERDMRSALRQLVLAARELRPRPGLGADLPEPDEEIAELLRRPAGGPARGGA